MRDCINPKLTDRLSAPFNPAEIKWKPQTIQGNRALAIAYVDARVIMDRLDQVFGIGGWQDAYERLDDGNVMCHLRVWWDTEWITKTDVGGQSEQPDEGDRCKAAFSDALKRAAVKFGVGRYLYRLGSQWVDYDPAKRRMLQTPTLPAWAVPVRKTFPENGAELLDRIVVRGRELHLSGLAESSDELLEHIKEAASQAGFPEDITTWRDPQIRVCTGWVKSFIDGATRARTAAAQHAGS